MQAIHQHIISTPSAMLVSTVLCTTAGISKNTIDGARSRLPLAPELLHALFGTPQCSLRIESTNVKFKNKVQNGK